MSDVSKTSNGFSKSGNGAQGRLSYFQAADNFLPADLPHLELLQPDLQG